MLKATMHLITIAAVIAIGTTFGQANDLADQLMDADETQFATFFPKRVVFTNFEKRLEKVMPVLIAEIDRKLPPDASDEDKENLAKRQVNAAVILLHMNEFEKIWPLLKHSPDPRVRSYLIHRIGSLGGIDPQILMNRIDDEKDITIRRVLILSLGEFSDEDLSLKTRTSFLPKLQEIYSTDTDPGLHAAAEWLLRKWDQQEWISQLNEKWANENVQVSSQWYITGQGQTMVATHGPVEFLMGSPPTEVGRGECGKGKDGPGYSEKQHRRRIDRNFAISTKSVTVDQYRKFNEVYKWPDRIPAAVPDVPVINVSWHQAVAYCNWLSNQEELPEDQWCFEITGKHTRLKEGYLSLNGYRLPMEAEMEYTTRAGAITARYYGETDELLSQYAWYNTNPPAPCWISPVGRLKPNDFGLFDMQGNCYNWCQDRYTGSYPNWNEDEAKGDREEGLVVKSSECRVWRGGSSIGSQTLYLRSASRCGARPTTHVNNVGFRLARTLPPYDSNINPRSVKLGK